MFPTFQSCFQRGQVKSGPILNLRLHVCSSAVQKNHNMWMLNFPHFQMGFSKVCFMLKLQSKARVWLSNFYSKKNWKSQHRPAGFRCWLRPPPLKRLHPPHPTWPSLASADMKHPRIPKDFVVQSELSEVVIWPKRPWWQILGFCAARDVHAIGFQDLLQPEQSQLHPKLHDSSQTYTIKIRSPRASSVTDRVRTILSHGES